MKTMTAQMLAPKTQAWILPQQQMQIGLARHLCFSVDRRKKYNNPGYWNPMKFCEGPDKFCDDQPCYYPGQTTGYHFSTDEDPNYPNEYYTNPLPDADGNTQPAHFDNFPWTSAEGCCWWGRGVIQTTGR
jgi:hypothetical protein